MSKLLFNENCLQVHPLLATKIGLNEAIFLQQIHYWCERRSNKNVFEGRRWVFNSYEGWNAQFPFWGICTIRRTLKSLRDHHLILTRHKEKGLNHNAYWMSVNYDALRDMLDENIAVNSGKGVVDNSVDNLKVSDQNDQIKNRVSDHFAKVPDHFAKVPDQFDQILPPP